MQTQKLSTVFWGKREIYAKVGKTPHKKKKKKVLKEKSKENKVKKTKNQTKKIAQQDIFMDVFS